MIRKSVIWRGSRLPLSWPRLTESFPICWKRFATGGSTKRIADEVLQHAFNEGTAKGDLEDEKKKTSKLAKKYDKLMEEKEQIVAYGIVITVRNDIKWKAMKSNKLQKITLNRNWQMTKSEDVLKMIPYFRPRL